MSRRGRALAIAAATLGALVVLAFVVPMVYFSTDGGRERLRSLVEERLDALAQGDAEVAWLQTDLLRGVRLGDVSIADTEGRPFFEAEEVALGYDIWSLLSRQIVLRNVEIVRARVVLDQPPGEEWNFLRIFEMEPDPDPDPDPGPGWGDHLELREVTIRESHVTVRTEWMPDPELSGEEREERIRVALADGIRERVEEVPGGYQQIMEFYQLNARLPRILALRPEADEVVVEVAELGMLAEPFRPPAAVIEELQGTFRVGNGLFIFEELEAALPGTELSGWGTLAFADDWATMELEADPVAFEDLRFLHLPLPEVGGGRLRAFVHMVGPSTRIVIDGVDLAVGRGRLEGHAQLHLGELIEIRSAEVELSGIETELLEQLVPGIDLPWDGSFSGRVSAFPTSEEVPPGTSLPLELDALVRFDDADRGRTSIVRAAGIIRMDGEPLRLDPLTVHLEPLQAELARPWAPDIPPGSTLSGPIRLTGSPLDRLEVEGDLRLDGPGLGASRIGLRGGVVHDEPVSFDGFEIALGPLRVGWLQLFTGDLPLDGTLEGRTVLDGSPERGLTFRTDLVHRGAADPEGPGEAVSRLEGGGEVATAGAGRVAANLRVHALSLTTIGRFAPDLELHGTAAGDVAVEGSFREMSFHADLELPAEGFLAAEGRMDLGADEAAYRLALLLEEVDVASLSRRAPRSTALGGSVRVEGEGTDPATLRGRLVAELTDEGGPEVFALATSVEAEGAGLARLDSLAVRVGTAESPDQGRGRVEGTFGLTGERRGRLAFEVAIDSLRLLEPFLPGDPEDDPPGVQPRPAAFPLGLEELPAQPVPREALAGALEARGTVEGNVERFDLVGELTGRELFAFGHRVENLGAEGRIDGVGGPAFELAGRARARSVLLAGFGYDSLSVEGGYQGGDPDTGTGRVVVHQTEGVQLITEGDFELVAGGGRVRLTELEIELPDIWFRDLDATLVAWGEDGLEIRDLRLEGVPREPFGPPIDPREPVPLVQVDGVLPREGTGALDLRIRSLGLSQLMILAQSDRRLVGRLDAEIEATGSLVAPVLSGTAASTGIRLEGEAVPDAEARFSYRGRELTASAVMEDATGLRLTAEALLPVDLGVVDVVGPRLLVGPIQVEVVLDELPLDALPALTDQVEELTGRAAGRVAIAGSFEAPEVEGELELDVPRLFLVPLGIGIRDVAGAARLQDRRLAIDSLVGYSGGPVRIAGGLDFPSLGEPVLDLTAEARRVWVIDTEDARLQVDADLTLEGPIEALALGGEVRTLRGVIYIPETEELAAGGPLDLEDPATFARVDESLRAARDELIDPTPLLENISGEIQLRIDRDVWLRSTEANVEIRTLPEVGPLVIALNGVRGRNITLEGSIAAGRGDYAFMGRRFALARGTVTFTGGPELDPFIRLTAEHEVNLPGREVFDIRIVLDGPLSDLETELSSTAQPPLSQTDLLSFMVFGREAGSLLQASGSSLSGQGAAGGPLVGSMAMRATQQMASIAVEAMVADLELEVARATGLDVLHIQPAELPDEIFTGGYLDVLRGTEIQAGTYINPRLFISGQARPTFVHPGLLVEYEPAEGYLWRTTWRPRFLPSAPTLARERPDRASVVGTFLFREWRF